MKKKVFWHLLVLLSGYVGCTAAIALDMGCPVIPVPGKTKVQGVAEDLLVNGVPMSMRRFESQQSPEQVLGFYRRQWAGRKNQSGSIEYLLPPWQVIAVGRGNCFSTVQLQSAGKSGSFGFFGVSSKVAKKLPAPPGAGFPMMAGSQVMYDLQSSDRGRSARTLLLENKFSMQGNANFYLEKLAVEGWSKNQGSQRHRTYNNGIVLTFRRGADWLDMVITHQSGITSVVTSVSR